MKRNLFLSVLVLSGMMTSVPVMAENDNGADTARVIDIEEVVIISTPKETGKLSQMPNAVSLIGQRDMERHNVSSLKGVSALVPNLFMPDYGSRLTSAIYVRGIGSRINTPAVGLYVDNIPYYDKSAFDFRFYDIERVDVLRGPQGTLYGRNSMGGLVRVNTRNPFYYQGTNVNLGMATADAHRHFSLTHYHRLNNNFAFSAGGYYDGSNGFFHNTTRHARQDKMNSGGGRVRAIYLPTNRLKFDFTLGYDYTHEGGYPYYYLGQLGGTEAHPDAIGRISANEKSSYTRGMLNAGLSTEYKTTAFTLNSVTSFQHLSDRMFMDQDFLADNIYTLEQSQRLSVLGEELTIKNNGHRTWNWLNGIALSKQWLRTIAPVTFLDGGVAMLEDNINAAMGGNGTVGAPAMTVKVNDDVLQMGGRFQTPMTNLAVFHQSTLNITNKLSATAGLRIDYEHNSLTYLAPGEINYDFSMSMMGRALSVPNLKASPLFDGKMSSDYVEFLPKVAFKYEVSENTLLYASAAKGFRSGGYNVQMFSDLLQSSMRGDMMQGASEGVSAQLDRMAAIGMPAQVIQMIKGQLPNASAMPQPDVKAAVRYKPEYSWNYELGARTKAFDQKLSLDVALFFSTIRNQQIARFAESNLGRMMVNAGRSHSYGVEASLRCRPVQWLKAWLNYGFTQATFTKYDEGKGNDHTGKRVPFIPKHTINVGADFDATSKLTLGLNMLANGRIYWNEANTASQSIYTTFGAHAKYDFGSVAVNLWGRNLTNRHYHTFYFESMNRGYAQKGTPLQVGMDVSVKF